MFFFLFCIADTSKSTSLHDAGFCSGSSELGDDYQSDRQQNSPSSTDNVSEDSVDIKLNSICVPSNKRKSYEGENDVPLKKRIKYESVFGKFKDQTSICNKNGVGEAKTFRPWAPPTLPNEAEVLIRHPGVTTLHRAPVNSFDISSVLQQEQPLALVSKQTTENTTNECQTEKEQFDVPKISADSTQQTTSSKNKSQKKKNLTRLTEIDSSSNQKEIDGIETTARNYKNMTRERRIEANARERTRVHTISAAFETLRQSIPSYSNTQKLSKLSVLRVACAYILTLSRMNGDDYSADQSQPSLASCMNEITKTIQTEGKVRKRKDDQ